AASATAVTVHARSTSPLVKMPHDHTRSAFDRNFIAAAISRNPITTFTRAIHGPDRGSWLTSCGAIASATNGSAKVAEYASNPAAPATAERTLPKTVNVRTMPTPYSAAEPAARARVGAACLVK